MSDVKGQQEPSMEEILASIRRIIAEDGEAARSMVAVDTGSLPAADEEILELTHVAADDPLPAAAGPAPPSEPEPEPYRPPPPRPRRVEAPTVTEEPHLLSARSAAASTAAFAEMSSRLRDRRVGELPLGNGALTLEDMVRDLMKPMLREWLDANLPTLVERLVQEEIRRIAREAM